MTYFAGQAPHHKHRFKSITTIHSEIETIAPRDNKLVSRRRVINWTSRHGHLGFVYTLVNSQGGDKYKIMSHLHSF
jgi:hypothetical protein